MAVFPTGFWEKYNLVRGNKTQTKRKERSISTGNQGSMIVPQYGSSKITVFVWGKNTILKFVRHTIYKSMKLTLQLVVVVLIAPTKFRDNLSKFTLHTIIIYKVGDFAAMLSFNSSFSTKFELQQKINMPGS